ncbi:hypothetical protein OUZ56_016608 [Daphnia magna]|uniref:Uncharacterized protein n=1 Tax=Daphnia magna TaxID=35525 RepID=A0ABR0AR45_9CRUS|nr:hypothetical protein OUZ56_016608 [Daphnia magna]
MQETVIDMDAKVYRVRNCVMELYAFYHLTASLQIYSNACVLFDCNVQLLFLNYTGKIIFTSFFHLSLKPGKSRIWLMHTNTILSSLNVKHGVNLIENSKII